MGWGTGKGGEGGDGRHSGAKDPGSDRHSSDSQRPNPQNKHGNGNGKPEGGRTGDQEQDGE